MQFHGTLGYATLQYTRLRYISVQFGSIRFSVANKQHDESMTNNNIECSFFTDLNNDSFVFDINDPQEANKEACCAKFNRYINLPILHYKNDPLKWWEDDNVKLPTLYILAMQYLCIPEKSAPSERLWSIACKILTKERNRLDSEIVASLVFLKENGHILEKKYERN